MPGGHQARDDIRLHRGFLRHAKTKRLKKALGAEAVVALLQLWCWTAENHPEGRLDGLSQLDVALAADWEGDPADFVTALLEVRFLDGMPGKFHVHDWNEHQPWISRRESLREWSARANAKRWGRRGSGGWLSRTDSVRESGADPTGSPSGTPPFLRKGEEPDALAPAGPCGPPLAQEQKTPSPGALRSTCSRGPYCDDATCCQVGAKRSARRAELAALDLGRKADDALASGSQP